jgi:hypothetical protein
LKTLGFQTFRSGDPAAEPRGIRGINPEEAGNLFVSLLKNPNLPTTTKYTVLSSFADEYRAELSSTVRKMNRAFNDIQKKFSKEIGTAVQKVYDEFRARYIDGDLDIYENETGPFFVMYNSWNGKLDAVDELRRLALRTLTQHPEAVEKLWSSYPEPEKHKEDNISRSRFNDVKDSPFITLQSLIDITREMQDLHQINVPSEKITYWEDQLLQYPKQFELTLPKDAYSVPLLRALIESGLVKLKTSETLLALPPGKILLALPPGKTRVDK